jgi:hypothetical protein
MKQRARPQKFAFNETSFDARIIRYRRLYNPDRKLITADQVELDLAKQESIVVAFSPQQASRG